MISCIFIKFEGIYYYWEMLKGWSEIGVLDIILRSKYSEDCQILTKNQLVWTSLFSLDLLKWWMNSQTSTSLGQCKELIRFGDLLRSACGWEFGVWLGHIWKQFSTFSKDSDTLRSYCFHNLALKKWGYSGFAVLPSFCPLTTLYFRWQFSSHFSQ